MPLIEALKQQIVPLIVGAIGSIIAALLIAFFQGKGWKTAITVLSLIFLGFIAAIVLVVISQTQSDVIISITLTAYQDEQKAFYATRTAEASPPYQSTLAIALTFLATTPTVTPYTQDDVETLVYDAIQSSRTPPPP